MEDRAGGSGPIESLRSGEDIECFAFLFRIDEALGLKVEHGSISTAERH